MATCATIGEVIKECQAETGISVNTLAEVIPADPRTIKRYRAGKCLSPETAAILAGIFKSKKLKETYCGECPLSKLNLKRKTLPEQSLRKFVNQIISR